ncbi:DMT family transporter [Sulfurospirillum arcachonense]|uniref:DMT family transporter n=1 Tax=Sulfurospirillum arcachonense TaxID=57666 RepID=UPI00046ADE5D|nr:multidrug resistance efflux transporter family protein [Sulfurospirillum arcachonense]
MLKLILLGILSGAFFSTTFVLNEVMSLAGGHWIWSASLRYVFMIIFLVVILWVQGGITRLKNVLYLFTQYWLFWIVSGSIGFGMFYALICFSADFSPGWVIAATWQFTVVASLFVFMFFGRTFPKRIWIFSLMIFIGVCFVNLSHIDNFNFQSLLLGGIPVLIAAFCYPLGNQLVWEAKHGMTHFVPKIDSPLLNNAFNKVMLLSLGSLPLWIVLVLIINPELPKYNQVLNTSLVALFSGVFATSIFLYARNHAKNTNELAGVDATQASEVVFALIGSMLLLGSSSLNLISIFGLFMILVGLILFVKYQNMKKD